jgi:hypothetical protein
LHNGSNVDYPEKEIRDRMKAKADELLQQGMTQAEVAAATGLSRPTVAKLKKSNRTNVQKNNGSNVDYPDNRTELPLFFLVGAIVVKLLQGTAKTPKPQARRRWISAWVFTGRPAKATFQL